MESMVHNRRSGPFLVGDLISSCPQVENGALALEEVQKQVHATVKVRSILMV
jgi:hypothetical protein